MLTLLSFALASGVAAPQTVSPKDRCTALDRITIPASAIGLPTNGARVTDATFVPADVATSQPSPGAAPSADAAKVLASYCIVSGTILSVDPKATAINFKVALPLSWNRKTVTVGGAGLDGIIPAITDNFLNTSPAAATPLARGYAVLGGDSGHQTDKSLSSSFDPVNQDGLFLANDEVFANYRGDAVKKTHDAAFIVISAFYGQVPVRSYFLGGSKGGGEAIVAVSRFAVDYDGAVALYPARDLIGTQLGMLSATQAMAKPGAYLDLAKREALARAAMARCDGEDGVKDGIISDVARCTREFDPATAMLDGKPLRCRDGRDTGDDCLSDAQVKALREVGGPTSLPIRDNGARQVFPGFNIMTADLGGTTRSPLAKLVTELTIGVTPPSFPLTKGNSFAAYVTDNMMKYGITRDERFNYLSLDFDHPGSIGARLNMLAAADRHDRDLRTFAARGGKLLIMHGTDDLLISPRATEQYVAGLRRRMGASKVDGFLRFYEVPGFGHAISTVFLAGWDQLSALEDWVERGVDPATNQVVTDLAGVPGRTRPLCLFPTWPHYRGSGDVNAAASFTCQAAGPIGRTE